MAPDPRLAPGGWDEVREAVAALHRAGIEVIVDVVFNHTGEGDELGPTLSLRGLDNATYYRLRPDAPRHYVNDAGCGNILAMDRAPVVRLALDALRAWAEFGGVDGFRFDLATTLARRTEGFDAQAPFLAALLQDPVLRELKLIAEPWDIGPGGYQLGKFPGPLRRVERSLPRLRQALLARRRHRRRRTRDARRGVAGFLRGASPPLEKHKFRHGA